MTRVETSDIAVHSNLPSEEKGPPIVVLKFGGTSLGTSRRIGLAALRVKEQIALGFLPVAVVSAKGRTTDRLLRQLRAVCRQNGGPAPRSKREVDRALATGETLSAALLAAALGANGIRAQSVSAAEAVLIARGPYGAARLTQLKPGRIARLLDNGIVPVVAGFQGIREDGEIVTLGRGSSDVTAVFLAAQLGATACHIVTDVAGVHEEDPRLAPDSPRFSALSFEDLVEITDRGAHVVHPQAARAAHSGSVPLHIYHYGAELGHPEGTYVGNVR
jgi:aspartate kinase